MLGGVLDLRQLTVSDIMVHRTKMDAIDADLPTDQIVDAALKSSHTRVPLWRGEREEIVGVLHAKTLLRALREAGGDLSKLDIMGLVTPPWFVPDTTTLKDQLNAFLKRKAHFAIVVDEYGEVMGLVTLEDIIEEIVGDITDETDIASIAARPQPDGSVIVEFPYAGHDYLAREVLKEAGDAVVLEPEEARRAVAEAAEAVLGAVKS